MDMPPVGTPLVGMLLVEVAEGLVVQKGHLVFALEEGHQDLLSDLSGKQSVAF